MNTKIGVGLSDNQLFQLEEVLKLSDKELKEGIILENIDDQVYHHPDFPGLSNSHIKHLKQSYNHYLAAKKHARDKIEEQQEGMIRNLSSSGTYAKDLDNLQFGCYVHDLILLPEQAKKKYKHFNPPKCDIDGRKKEDREKKKHWHETVYQPYMDSFIGMTAVNDKDYNKASSMVNSVLSHPLIKSILDSPDTKTEVSFLYKCNKGILRKCRADIFNDNLKLPDGTPYCLVADLKTTVDASPIGFSRAIANFDYDMQAAYYSDLISKVVNKPVNFCFIPVEKSEPHGTVILSTENIIDVGRELYKSLIEYFLDCKNNKTNKGYSTDVETAFLPAWGHDLYSRGKK